MRCGSRFANSLPRVEHHVDFFSPEVALARCGRGRVVVCALFAMIASLSGCADREPDGDQPDLSLREERAEVERTPAGPPYRLWRGGDWGSVTGAIAIRGEARRDTVVPVHDVPHVCGERVTLPVVRAQRDRLADAVVWIENIREGKALPIERRFEALYTRCRLEPYVQSAIAGGILLIRSADGIEHRTRLIRTASGEALTTVRQGDAGSLIPVPDALAEPGLLELRSEPRPWARAWLRVFDHPYHAVTGLNGTFRFDSLPPGRHRLIAWHPRLGRLASDFELPPGGEASVELTFEAR